MNRVCISYVVDITIKQVFTSNSRIFTIMTGWNTRQFIENMSPLIKNWLGIELDNIELTVDADPLSQINTRVTPEYFPAIEPSYNTIEELWGSSIKYRAFYVRRKDDIRILNFNTAITNNLIQNYVVRECPICLVTTNTMRYHSCQHSICNNCNNNCVSHNLLSCPECRSERL